MRKTGYRFVVVAVLVLVAVSGAGVTQVQAQTDDCGFPYTAEDATGVQVTLDEEPETVVTLGPSATQTLVEIGSGDKVDGAGGFSEYLGIEFETVTPLDEETGFFQYETDAAAENVVDLDPDLVIVAGTIISDDTVENTYRTAGDLDVYKTSPSATADDIPPKVEDIGRLVGNCEGADGEAEDIREEIEVAEQATAGQERPGFIYLTSANEGGGASVLSEGSFVVDVVETAGGENVLADEVETPFGTVGSEVLLDEADDINWIVTTEGTEVPEEGIPYGEINAVQQDRIIKLNPNEINQDAPRITRPLSALSEAFFPEAREDRGVIGGGGGGGSSDDDIGLSLGVADTSPLELIGNSSVAEFVGGPVTTVALDGEYAGNVSVEPLAEAQTPGTFVSGANVTLPDEALDADGTVTFSVERSTLESAGIAVGELHVAKKEGGWNVLETDRADLREEALLEARTTFSEFAVVASSEPTAVADASIEDGEVTLSAAGSSDEYGEIDAYVWNVGGETYEGDTVTFEADGGGEATLTVTNDAGLTGEATVEFSVESEETEETEEGETEDAETEEETDGESETETDTETETDDGGGEGLPGFTAVAAVLAVVVFVAVRLRERE